jgi:hypothetical protein
MAEVGGVSSPATRATERIWGWAVDALVVHKHGDQQLSIRVSHVRRRANPIAAHPAKNSPAATPNIRSEAVPVSGSARATDGGVVGGTVGSVGFGIDVVEGVVGSVGGVVDVDDAGGWVVDDTSPTVVVVGAVVVVGGDVVVTTVVVLVVVEGCVVVVVG